MNFLIITDRPQDYSKFKNAFSLRKYTPVFCTKKDDFYFIIRQKNIKILILDIMNNDSESIHLLKEIKYFDSLIEVIIVGPSNPTSEMIELIKQGARDYLIWPFDIEILLHILEKVEEKMSLRKETFLLERELTEKYVFHGMVGKSISMLEVFSLIEKIAKYPNSVLITGGTGTGKEMVARAIHELSNQRDKKFVVCDCTAIPESLFESELFGYVRGAFTGAEKSKNGLFKEANNGTIFLDEIGEIPIHVQPKLLRVLEEHKFRPLGSNEIVNIDVNVISATSRDLRDSIKIGRFREDLFHRINVLEIKLPPLKDRREDIPLLCRYFLDKYNKKYDKNVVGISQRAQKILFNYSWSGNVRELENVIERSVMLTHEKFIDIKDLPEYIKKHVPESIEDDFLYPYSHLTMKEIEKKHILEVLKITNNNKQKTAHMLGITRQALYRKLKKLNIPY